MKSNMKIAILTLVKNNEKELFKYDFFLKEIKKNLSVDSCILEYGSIDNSKKISKEITKFYCEEPDISYKTNVSLEYLNPICEYLNILKEYTINNDNYDYIIFADIAITTWPSIKSIENSLDILNNKPNLYAVSALGISEYRANLIYYDIWSLIIDGKIQNHKIWTKNEIHDNMLVDAAYGGFCIYKTEMIKDLKFMPVEVPGYICPGHGPTRLASEFCSVNLELRSKNYYNFINKDLILFK